MDHAAVSALGLFEGDAALGGSDSCGLRGISAGCHDEALANGANAPSYRLPKRPIAIVTEIFTKMFENILPSTTD